MGKCTHDASKGLICPPYCGKIRQPDPQETGYEPALAEARHTQKSARKSVFNGNPMDFHKEEDIV